MTDHRPWTNVRGLFISHKVLCFLWQNFQYEFQNPCRLYRNERETSSVYAQFSDPPFKIVFNPEGNDSGNACIANISPRERKKRRQFGIMQISFGVIFLATLLLFGVDKPWRLLVLMPFAAGASSIFQALDKT